MQSSSYMCIPLGNIWIDGEWWNGVGWSHIPLFDFVKKNGMEWDVMEPIPSNTTHLLNFPFLLIWSVYNEMEHINNTLTILSLFFLLTFF